MSELHVKNDVLKFVEQVDKELKVEFSFTSINNIDLIQ